MTKQNTVDWQSKPIARTIQKIIELIKKEIWLIREYGRSSGNLARVSLIGGFYKLLKFRLLTALIYKPRKLYYDIRNHHRFYKFDNQNFSIMWELCKPLTLTYAFRSTDNYCPSCKKLNAKEERDQYAPETLYHAEFVKYYERPIWSFNFKYYYTACTCEDLLFQPLEEYYGSGGESGSSLWTRSDAQWSINEELGWDSDPMKRHKKQLLPRNWKSKKIRGSIK